MDIGPKLNGLHCHCFALILSNTNFQCHLKKGPIDRWKIWNMVKFSLKLTAFYPGQATGGGASNGPKEEHHQMIFILLNEPVLAFKFQISRGQLK